MQARWKVEKKLEKWGRTGTARHERDASYGLEADHIGECGEYYGCKELCRDSSGDSLSPKEVCVARRGV